MKILQLTWTLTQGGLERFVVDLCNELAEDPQQQIYLCTIRDDSVGIQGFFKFDISDKVKYINLKVLPGRHIELLFQLFKLIRRVRPDIIHSHGSPVNYMFLFSFLYKIKHFNTIHNDASREINSKFEFILRKFIYQFKFAKPVTISKASTTSFLSFYKINSFAEIYNGNKKVPLSKDFEEIRTSFLKLRQNFKYIFINLARFAPQKNHKMLINVFNRLISEGYSVSLIIIGGGQESYEALDLKNRSSEGIFFWGEKKNIADYLTMADAFCLSSIFEGMPISLIEAMAYGCTPICTPVGGITDVIINRVNGFLAASVNEDDYYDSMLAFITDTKLISKMKLIQQYEESFSIQKCAIKHLNLYNNKYIS